MKKSWRKPPPDSQANMAMLHVMAPDEYKKRALADGVDALAKTMEDKWGIDRLPLLVNDQLRAAFYRQQALFNEAITSGSAVVLDLQCGGMKRAWQALDQAAAQAGHNPVSADVWELKLPHSGKIIAIVKTSAEAHLVETPKRETWTLSEIAHLIDGMDDKVAEIKRVFPGAEVTAIHKTQTPPAAQEKPFDWSKGDALPF